MKKFISILLSAIMLVQFIPVASYVAMAKEIALLAEDEIAVDNGYIQIISKTDGSSFGVHTLKGSPSKRYDDNKPLLYDGDDKFATSYTTVRIVRNAGTSSESVKDYVYGSSKGVMTEAPHIVDVDGKNKTISSTWAIDGVIITQNLSINSETATEEAGYAMLSYAYTNNTGVPVSVGVRVLLDTKLADTDGGRFFKNGGTTEITNEVTYTGDNVPEWYSISDSVYYSTTSAYGLLKNNTMRRKPTAVTMAHWANLANTLWEYEPSTSFNFADYYNEYLTADSAIAIYFEPENVPAGASLAVDTFYGVGELNGNELSQGFCSLTITQKEELKINADGTGYENDGLVTLYLTVDNSDVDSVQINDAYVRVAFEDKLFDDQQKLIQEPAIWVPTLKEEDEIIHIGNIDRGDIKRNIPITLKARPIYENPDDPADIVYEPTEGYELRTYMDTRKVKLELYGEMNEIPSVASKVITLPAFSDELPDIGFLDFDPKTIYYEGYSFVNVKGFGDEFNVLQDKTNWVAYLRNIVTNEHITVDSFVCSVDTVNKHLGLSVDMGGNVGVYELTIEFRNNLAELGKHTFTGNDNYITSTTDERYKNRGYSIVSVARLNENRNYEMKMFVSEPGYTAEAQFNDYRAEIEENNGEMLIEGRGVFKVVYKDGMDPESTEITDLCISTDTERNNPVIAGFEAVPGGDPVKVNRILYYDSSVPLRFTTEFDGDKPTAFEMVGDGHLSIINASTIWKNRFKIRLVTGERITYDPNDYSSAPKLQLLGGGWLVQNLGGFFFDLNYGVLICSDGMYGIDFSGSVSFPLGFSMGDDDEKKDDGTQDDGNQGGQGGGTPGGTPGGSTQKKDTPAPTGTGDAPDVKKDPPKSPTVTQKDNKTPGDNTPGGNTPGGNTPGGTQQTPSNSSATPTKQPGAKRAKAKDTLQNGNSATNALGGFNDGGSLALSIDSVLFGEHENKDRPEIIETGFVGCAASMSIELPQWIFPAGGKESDNKQVQQGAKENNPTQPGQEIVKPQDSKPGQGPLTQKGQLQNANAGQAKKNTNNKLSAFNLGFGFNTYDLYAGVDLGIGFGPVNTAFRMSVAETGNGKPMLDSLYLEVKGFEVPIVPPNVVTLIGLGGGISDLAASIGYDGPGRPPVTVSVMAAIGIASVMGLRGDFSISGNGLTLSISGAPYGLDLFTFIVTGMFDWTTGFSMLISGTVDIFSGVVLGNVSLGITTEPSFVFLGKIQGSLNIPGLGTLAGVTLGISDEYIAGGVRILIFSGGFIYYYSSDNFRLLTGDEVAEIENVDIAGADELISDPNDNGPNPGGGNGGKQRKVSFLEVIETRDEATGETRYMGIGAGAEVVLSSTAAFEDVYLLEDTTSFEAEITNDVIKNNDVVARIYYEGDTVPEIAVTKPDGSELPLVAYDFEKTQEENNEAGANFLAREKIDETTGETQKYVYVSLYNDVLTEGSWSFESVNGVNITDYTILTLPTSTSKLEVNSASIDGTTLTTSWTASEDAEIWVSLVPCDENGEPQKVYTNAPDGSVIVSEAAGYPIGRSADSGEESFEVNIPSGKYVVRVDSLVNQVVFTSAFSDTPLEFVNPNTIKKPEVTAEGGGDGRINITSTVPENATGVYVKVFEKAETEIEGEENIGSTEETWRELKSIGGYIGDYLDEGEVTTYLKGHTNLVNDDGEVVATDAIIPGNTYKIEVIAQNNKTGSGWFASEPVVIEDIYVPVPNPPEVNVKIRSLGEVENKETDKSVEYIQSDNNDFIIEYEITNMDTDGNDEVSVKFDIDEKQFGDTVINNAQTGNKGYCLVNLTDGDHFVDIAFINKKGDVYVYTKKISIDSVSADLKIQSPMQGGAFDKDEGILIDFVTDPGALIEIKLDGETVINETLTVVNDNYDEDAEPEDIERYNVNTGAFIKTLPVSGNDASHDVEIKVTDVNGNSTEYFATVYDSRISKIAGISLRAMNPEGSTATELEAVVVDKEGEEIDVHLPTNTLKWELLSDPSEATLVVDNGNRNAVVVPSGNNGFSVKAEWKVSDTFKFVDIYDSAIVGTQEESEDVPGSPDSNGDGILDIYQIKVKYKVSGARAGSVSVAEEIVTITDENGEYATSGKVKISGSTVTANKGYKFAGWKDKNGEIVCTDEAFADYEFIAEGKNEYTFTAQLKNSSSGSTVTLVSGDKSDTELPSDVEAMVEEARKSLTDSADISAHKMYATLSKTVTESDNTAYVGGNDNKVENYIVYGVDETKDKYVPTLPENTELASDVVYVDTLKPVDKILIDFKVADGGDNKAIYKFSEALGKWICIGGTYDDYRKVIKLTVNTTGKYAVLSRSETDIFEDVDGAWSELYINSLAYAGLVNGYAVEDKFFFRPGNNITRGEFVKMLVSAKGVALDSTDVSMFDDAAEIAEWVKPYAAVAAKNGWLKGSANGDKLYANLGAKITRQDAMTIIYRAFFGDNTDKKQMNFIDVQSISDYAYDAVAVLTNNGVVSGFTDNTVRPRDNVKREQVAKMLWYCIIIAD